MFNPLQVILLALLVGVWTWQKYNLQMFYYASVAYLGFFTGLIMGDVTTGMLVGGSMCLMSLGLFGAGGSSVPEYQVGCIAGAAFAIAMGKTGQDAVTTALTVGVPVAALGTQLDVLGTGPQEDDLRKAYLDCYYRSNHSGRAGNLRIVRIHKK